MSDFLDKSLKFEDSLYGLTELEINQLIPMPFPGKLFFMKFYIAHNGGYFSDGAYFNREIFYPSQPEGYNTMGVESFYPIAEKDECSLRTINKEWNLMKIYFKNEFNGRFNNFVAHHVPFAGNGAGDFFWLDIKTGIIKYINHEDISTPDDIVIVAPSFYDFCINLHNEDYWD